MVDELVLGKPDPIGSGIRGEGLDRRDSPRAARRQHGRYSIGKPARPFGWVDTAVLPIGHQRGNLLPVHRYIDQQRRNGSIVVPDVVPICEVPHKLTRLHSSARMLDSEEAVRRTRQRSIVGGFVPM